MKARNPATLTLPSAGEGFEDELGTGADGGCVFGEEAGDVVDRQQEGFDEFVGFRLCVSYVFHLGEYDVHRLVGEAG